MSLFEATVTSIGEVVGICEFKNEDIEVLGILVEGEALAREILMDLVAYQSENYYDHTTESFLERPTSTVTLSKTTLMSDATDSITISGIPADGTLLIDDVEYTVEADGTFSFETDLAGTYDVKVIAFPYLDFDQEVIAT